MKGQENFSSNVLVDELNQALKANNFGDHKFKEGDIFIVSCLDNGTKMIVKDGKFVEYENSKVEYIDEIEAKIREILIGIDKDEVECRDGWWPTSSGAKFGESKLNEIIEFVKQLNSTNGHKNKI